MRTFNFATVHPSWQVCLEKALAAMDSHYLQKLYQTDHWLPGAEKIFNAFSLPLEKVNYILFGESPYPRAVSANGFAFWDSAVTELWCDTGMSKQVNRATSLRNIIKMLLLCEDVLQANQLTQDHIAKINKDRYVTTNEELFNNFLNHGFLLLNTTLVLRPDEVRQDARAWQPFIKTVIDYIYHERPHVQLILLGNVANTINKLLTYHTLKTLQVEHPYNISFITNAKVIDFFRPLYLLRKK